MQRTGKELHGEVEHLREAGKFEEALKLAEEAKSAYRSEGNMVGLADIYGSNSLAYRHLGNLSEAKSEAEEAVKIARENNLKGDVARPLFNLAKVKEELGELKEAVEDYKEALRIFEKENPTLHNRSGVAADMGIHLFICEYKNGDKTALQRVLDAIHGLQESDEKKISKYNFDVWLSGAYMKLAHVLKSDNLEEARKYLQMAKEIIDANSDLKLRKGQWEKLNASF